AVVLPARQEGGISSIAFSPDRRLSIAGGYDRTTILWEVSARPPHAVLAIDHRDPAFSVAWSAEGARFASKEGTDSIVVGDAAELASTARQPVGRKVLSNLAFAAGGKKLLYGTPDGAVLWDVEQRVESMIRRLPSGAPVVRVAYSRVGDLAAVSDRDGAITLLDARTLQLKAGPPLGHEQNVLSLAFSPDGQLLASASEEKNRSLVLWRVSDRREIWQAASAPGEEPFDAAFSPDSAMLASARADGPIMLWDVASGQVIG